MKNMSHGQNLSSASGEPEFFAQLFFKIPATRSLIQCTIFMLRWDRNIPGFGTLIRYKMFRVSRALDPSFSKVWTRDILGPGTLIYCNVKC
jgi:hypothetical protein